MSQLGLKLSVIGLTLVVGLVAMECAFRVAVSNPYRNENLYVHVLRIPHAERSYVTNRRYIDPDYSEVQNRTDSRSYQLPSKRFPAPDWTVAFLGGSTTENIAVAERLRFPAVASTALEERGLKVNALNIGMSGNTMHDSVNVLLNHVVLDEPDIAVVMHASNDIGLLRAQGDYQARMSHALSSSDVGTWLKRRLSSSSWIVSRLRYFAAVLDGMGHQKKELAPNRKTDLAGMGADFPEQPYRERIRAFIAVARAFGIEPVLMTQPFAEFSTERTPDWMHDSSQVRANEIIREEGAAADVVVIDLVAFLDTLPDVDEPYRVFYDGIHLTDYGSEAVGKYIADVLYEQIMSKAEPRSARSGS